MKKIFLVFLLLISMSYSMFAQCTCDAGCTSLTDITIPFTKDGTGEFCFRATCIGSTINSWNLDKLEINDIIITNTWLDSSSLPPMSDGYYYIYYKSSVSWGHAEFLGTCSGTTTAPTTPPTDTIAPTADPTAAPNETPAPTDAPTETAAPTATPGPTSVPTATPVGVTASPTDAPVVTDVPVITTAPTDVPTVTDIPTAGPTTVPGSVVYSAASGKIYKNGVEIKLYGLNWFGMETTDHVLHGLWTGRQMADFMADFVSKGFNALRLPVSPESINPGYLITAGPYSGEDCEALCGKDGRTALEYSLAKAQAAGMYVLLDFHTCNPSQLGSGLPGTPIGCSGYSLSAWLADLKTLASLSVTYTNVVGIDLCNEPWNLTYTDWANYASQGGQAVLSINPNVTIFVEGVGNLSATGGYGAYWGENLYEGASISGIPGNRLVFSPHIYGPSVAVMDYYSASNYPSNMPTIWNNFVGHLVDEGFTVILGEIGGTYVDADKILQDNLITWMISKNMKSSFWWCVNPNSGDTGGVLLGDWITWNTDKLTLLQRLMN